MFRLFQLIFQKKKKKKKKKILGKLTHFPYLIMTLKHEFKNVFKYFEKSFLVFGTYKK